LIVIPKLHQQKGEVKFIGSEGEHKEKAAPVKSNSIICIVNVRKYCCCP